MLKRFIIIILYRNKKMYDDIISSKIQYHFQRKNLGW